MYLTPTHFCNNPFIYPGHAVQSRRESLAGLTQPQDPPKAKEDLEQNRGLQIWDLWKKGTEFIIYIRVVNTYSTSCIQNTLEKILQKVEC